MDIWTGRGGHLEEERNWVNAENKWDIGGKVGE